MKMLSHKGLMLIASFWMSVAVAEDSAETSDHSQLDSHGGIQCETRLSRELAKCSRKFVAPNHSTQIRIEKSARFAIENCTEELIPHMTAQEFLLKSLDEPDFKKQIVNCFSSRQLEQLRHFGIAEDHSVFKYKKCLRDAVDHERMYGHKKE